MPNVHHCLEGSDTFFKKGADKDGALKFSATNKDLKNIKYFRVIIDEKIFQLIFSLKVPPCELKHRIFAIVNKSTNSV